jgi:hypothetical protein
MILVALYLSEDQELQRQLVKFTEWLVVVGGLQVLALIVQAFVFWFTLNAIRRQVKIMEEHAKSLKDLSSVGRDNTEAAKLNAEAAKANADAAQKSIALVIQKERAHIKVEIGSDLTPDKRLGFEVKYRVISYGISNAIIQEAVANLTGGDTPGPDLRPFFKMRDLPSIVPPSTQGIEMTVNTLFSLRETPEIAEINSLKKFMILQGHIKYRDLLMNADEPDRITSFCHLWTVTDLPSFGSEPYCLWQKAGPPEANQET